MGACVQSVMVYGSETWSIKVDDVQRSEKKIRWMSGVTLRNEKSTDKRRKSLDIKSDITD